MSAMTRFGIQLPNFSGFDPGDLFDHARNLPRPVQPGGPKIMIGGGGEKRTLRLVARYADQCNVTGDVSTLARKIDVLRRHCAKVGRGTQPRWA